MTQPPLTLSRLQNGCLVTRASFIKQLTQRGFACLTIDDQRLLSALEEGLDAATALTGFRFPPNDDSPTVYTQVTRDTFSALFKVSTLCFQALCVGHQIPDPLTHALQALSASSPALFSDAATPHEPFCDTDVFAQSFFNLFNYNNGLLNPHFDRSLLTVIKARSGENTTQAQSALWIKSETGDWTNADEAVRPDEVIIMIGEDCEALGFAVESGLYAAEHAVRVNPAGEYIAHSHFRRDPSTPSEYNRSSAAFILRHEPASVI